MVVLQRFQQLTRRPFAPYATACASETWDDSHLATSGVNAPSAWACASAHEFFRQARLVEACFSCELLPGDVSLPLFCFLLGRSTAHRGHSTRTR